MTRGGVRQALASGEWLSAARIRLWAGFFLIAQIVIGLALAAGAHGWLVTLHGAGTTDFVSFYAAGKVAAGAAPAQVYDRAVHFAAERAATDPRIDYIHFFYPPVYLLYCRALAALPYLVAFYGFATATLLFYLCVMRRILADLPRGWLLPVLGFSPVLWNVGFGQNAALTAALFGAGCLLLQGRRPFLAGLVLGLLIYKPHTALLLPAALLAGRQGRAVIGAAASMLACIGASGLAFGWAPWAAFAHALVQSGHDFAAGGITPFSNMVNIAGALRDHGVGARIATRLQTAMGLGCAACVAWAWRRDRPGGATYAVLAAGAVLSMPVVLFYDLLLPSVAAAFIIAQAHRTGFLRYEKSVLAVAWLMGCLAYPLSRLGHLPLGLCGALAVMALAVRRQGGGSFSLLNPLLRRLGQARPMTPGLAGLGVKTACQTDASD